MVLVKTKALFVSILAATLQGQVVLAAPNDSQVKQLIIQDSLASYPGNCPCPYNTDRAGRSCGRRSAYTRPGGYSPVCYEADVTLQMIRDYRASHGG